MNIKSFGIAIVAFLVISAIISIMVPKGSIEKTIKFVLSICFIFVVVTSVKSIKLEIPQFNKSQIQTGSESIYSLTLMTTKEILQNRIIDDLKTKGVNLEKIQINADILDDKSIIIDSVVYKTNSNEQILLIEKIIYENTGCKKIERVIDEEYIFE